MHLFFLATQLFFLFAASSFYHPKAIEAREISGVVLDAETKKALANVFVYTIKGEEEAVTNAKGAFTFNSWEAAPILLTVVHANYKTQVIKLGKQYKRLQIALQK